MAVASALAMTYSSLHDLLHGAREGSCHAKPTIIEDIHGNFEPFSLLCYQERYYHWVNIVICRLITMLSDLLIVANKKTLAMFMQWETDIGLQHVYKR